MSRSASSALPARAEVLALAEDILARLDRVDRMIDDFIDPSPAEPKRARARASG